VLPTRTGAAWATVITLTTSRHPLAILRLDPPSYRVDIGYTVPLDGWLCEGDEFIHVHVHFIGDHAEAGLILLLVQCFIAQEGRRNFIRR